MERTPEEAQALAARDAIWLLEELDRIVHRHGWSAAAFGVSLALAEVKSIADALPPVPPVARSTDRLPPERRRR